MVPAALAVGTAAGFWVGRLTAVESGVDCWHAETKPIPYELAREVIIGGKWREHPYDREAAATAIPSVDSLELEAVLDNIEESSSGSYRDAAGGVARASPGFHRAILRRLTTPRQPYQYVRLIELVGEAYTSHVDEALKVLSHHKDVEVRSAVAWRLRRKGHIESEMSRAFVSDWIAREQDQGTKEQLLRVYDSRWGNK